MGLCDLPWLAPLAQRFTVLAKAGHLRGHWAVQGYCEEELTLWAEFMLPLLAGSPLNVIYPEAEDLLLWVRDLQHRLSTRATEGKGVWVVYFENSLFLNESVQNALLKVVEEPPTPTHFVFCSTRADFLLNTLKSRCQSLRLPRPTPEVALSYVLTKISEPEVAMERLTCTDGKPLAAVTQQKQSQNKKDELTVPQQLQILARQSRAKGDWQNYRYILEQRLAFQETPHLNADLFMAIVKERCSGVV